MEGGSLSPPEFYDRFKGSLISARLSPDRPAGSPLLADSPPMQIKQTLLSIFGINNPRLSRSMSLD